MTDPDGNKKAVAPNMHATCLILGDRGLVITGASGSGKTALALRLVQSARREGHFARLVADDQLLASVESGRLVCRAPGSISGLVEMRGAGIVPVAYEKAAIVHLRVNLRPAGEIERIPDGEAASFALGGVNIRSIDLPACSACENEIVVLHMLFGAGYDAENKCA